MHISDEFTPSVNFEYTPRDKFIMETTNALEIDKTPKANYHAY